MTINDISKTTGKSAISVLSKVAELDLKKYIGPSRRYDFAPEQTKILIDALTTDKRYTKRKNALTAGEKMYIKNSLREGIKEKIIAKTVRCHITTIFAYKRKMREKGLIPPKNGRKHNDK